MLVLLHLSTLCLKNVPPFTCYNLDINDPITIKFLAEVLLRK